MPALTLLPVTRLIAGIVVLTVVTIEFGGTFMLRIAQGAVPMTPFQKAFAKAGHAHAGVLVVLSLVSLVLADGAHLSGPVGWVARLGAPVAAVLISAGFFTSSIGAGEVTKPNRLIVLVWLGALSLAAGMVTLGVGLIAA